MSRLDSILESDRLVIDRIEHTQQNHVWVILLLKVPKYHCTECNRYNPHRYPGRSHATRPPMPYRLEVFDAHE